MTSSVTELFCRADRRTHLTAQEGQALFERMRANGHHPVALLTKTKRPKGDAWPPLAAEDRFSFDPRAPGVGCLCGHSQFDPTLPPTKERPRPWRNSTPAGGLLGLDFDRG